MNPVDLLRKYRELDRDGAPLPEPRTAREFAALLGIHESYLSRCYDGKQPVGMKALRGLRDAFPQATGEVVEAILAGPKSGVPEDDPASPFYRQIEQVA